MSVATIPVCFVADMAKKKSRETKQLGNRIDKALYDRMLSFIAKNPWQPSETFILESALREYLDRHEPELPGFAKPKAERR